MRWTDPLGASNTKWSYFAPELVVMHEAHVEAVESGVHSIAIEDQPGCDVVNVTYDRRTTSGPRTVDVPIRNEKKDLTVHIDVRCA